MNCSLYAIPLVCLGSLNWWHEWRDNSFPWSSGNLSLLEKNPTPVNGSSKIDVSNLLHLAPTRNACANNEFQMQMLLIAPNKIQLLSNSASYVFFILPCKAYWTRLASSAACVIYNWVPSSISRVSSRTPVYKALNVIYSNIDAGTGELKWKGLSQPGLYCFSRSSWWCLPLSWCSSTCQSLPLHRTLHHDKEVRWTFIQTVCGSYPKGRCTVSMELIISYVTYINIETGLPLSIETCENSLQTALLF